MSRCLMEVRVDLDFWHFDWRLNDDDDDIFTDLKAGEEKKYLI